MCLLYLSYVSPSCVGAGELALQRNVNRTASIVAVESVTLLLLQKSDFDEVLQRFSSNLQFQPANVHSEALRASDTNTTDRIERRPVHERVFGTWNPRFARQRATKEPFERTLRVWLCIGVVCTTGMVNLVRPLRPFQRIANETVDGAPAAPPSLPPSETLFPTLSPLTTIDGTRGAPGTPIL